MPTLAKVFETVDAFVSASLAGLAARQENYRANKGHYWQGLRTHLLTIRHSTSSDGSKPGDNLDANPTDQFENWSAVFPEWKLLAVALPATFAVNTYDGPSGMGWEVVIEFFHNTTDLWRWVINVGPETYRARPWAKM